MKINRSHPRALSRSSKGAALIAVLTLLALLTVLALASLSAARRHAQLAHTSFLLIQQRELADSALRLSLLELAARGTQGLGRRSIELFGQSIAVDLELESGRIDLNYASEALLVAAFAGNDLSESEARRLASRIIDWRDVDDIAATQGAERSDYRRANRSGPRNGPFESVSEIRWVLGVEALSERVLDAFTVYSHLAEVRQEAAVPGVMNALKWAQARALDGRTWLSPGSASGGSPIAGEAVRVRACTGPAPLETCRTAIVRLTGDSSHPTLVFVWQ